MLGCHDCQNSTAGVCAKHGQITISIGASPENLMELFAKDIDEELRKAKWEAIGLASGGTVYSLERRGLVIVKREWLEKVIKQALGGEKGVNNIIWTWCPVCWDRQDMEDSNAKLISRYMEGERAR